MALPLKIEKLYKRFGDHYAIRDINLSLECGEIFGLLGPNGAGKTTIIASITTLERPDLGSVEVFGFDVRKEAIQAKSCFGVVHQEVIHTGFFDVLEVVKFQSGYYGIRNNKEREEYLLNRLGLWEHRHKKVKQLSGGMKRRLMIVKALVHSPKLLLLDEPTAGVDLKLRDSLWSFVEELKKEGVATLLTTHYLEEAEVLCDRVAIINNGRIYIKGYTRELISQFSGRKLILTLNQEFKNLKCKFDHLESKKEEKNVSLNAFGPNTAGTFKLNEMNCYCYTFNIANDLAITDFLKKQGIPFDCIVDLRVENGNLEEAFVRILSRSEHQNDSEGLT